MLITGVADRIPERIRRLVYLDAFLPDSGETAMGLADSTGLSFLRSNVKNGLIVPPWVKDTTAIPRDVPQPLRTFTDTLRLMNPAGRRVPATYILTFEPAVNPDPFQRFADRAAARGWPVFRLQLDTGNMLIGGGDPMQYLEKYRNRYWTFHLKDVVANRSSDTRLGQGIFDFKRFLAAVPDLDRKPCYVEDESPADELAAARSNCQYLQGLDF